MRKIFMGSLALLVFAVSIAVFQLSCSKEATAHNEENGGGNEDRMILYRRVAPNAEIELWAMNINGGNRHKINITLPQDTYLEGARVADDGEKIVFVAVKLNETDNIRTFYKCNLDGSGLAEIYTGQQIEEFVIQDVY